MKKLKLFLVLFLFGTAIYAQQTGYVKTAAPTYTNNTIAPISLTTGGALRVFLMGGSVTAAGDSSTQRQVIKVRPYNTDAFTITGNITNAGTFATQAAQSGTWNITNVSGTVSLPTGASTEATLSALNGKIPASLTVTSTRLLVDPSGVTSPVSLASVPSHAVTNAGTFAVQLRPATTGGASVFHLVSAATTNATVIKAGVGQVSGWYIYNSNAAARKVAFHNASTTPTAGAAIFYSLVIPAGSGANVSFPDGLAFSTGIAITTVTELADSGTTAVGASDLIINIFYY